MTSRARVALWIDHQQARIFHVDLDGFDEKTLRAPAHHVHRHPRGASEPHTHPDDERHFFDDVSKALASADEILLLGPSTAKRQFSRYLEEHAQPLASKVVGIETADHPTDAQIVAHVREHFRIPTPRLR